jgi:3D-(3,5/4)-trihydroxycyclohexane-1,2-dione acylhydrolase (decyclizing)
MITAAATATVNHVPLLLFPADAFACRQPDPVLQQFEQVNSLATTTNDAYKAVTRYWDRIVRPEQLMSAMINAMRVLTDTAETGAVAICLPQDAEGETYDYPEEFFEKRVHKIVRTVPAYEELEDALRVIASAKKPLIICGGGVRYSEAGDALESFCEQFNIPFAETQSGKSACRSSSKYNLGGLGVTGNSAGNDIAKEADVIIGVGTRFSDFTTASKSLFRSDAKVVTINTSRFDAYKLGATKIVADAKLGLEALALLLSDAGYKSAYTDEYLSAKAKWDAEMDRLAAYRYDENFKPLISAGDEKTIPEFASKFGTITQTSALCLIREKLDADAICVAASGSLPGDLQRMWTTDSKYSYNMEYGYSCMGYEIAGALGSKLAEPEKEVYALVGDGAYLMLHSELITSIQERKKINVLLFDNCGFGCINNLEMSNGIGNLATEFRYRDGNGELLGDLIPIDFAKAASGYGVKTYTARTLEELEAALEDSKKQTVSTLIDIKALPKTMTDGYGAWWHVGIASTSANEKVRAAFENKEENRKKARKY